MDEGVGVGVGSQGCEGLGLREGWPQRVVSSRTASRSLPSPSELFDELKKRSCLTWQRVTGKR